MSTFKPNCLPLLIGSLPLEDFEAAAELIFDYTPQIPLWPQLPHYPEEGMLAQFLPGMPGLSDCDGKVFIDAESEAFAEDLLAFFEQYLMVTDGGESLDGTRFAMTPEIARGFFSFLSLAEKHKGSNQVALKGQVTGPITFCTGVVDQDNRAIFYNDQLRDVAVKLLAMKARWQAQKLAGLSEQPIIFFDEPALAGFGSSAFITISTEDIIDCFAEVFEGVRAENGLIGVHVCANTEWSLLFDAKVDIVSYDAYGFFDKFILYPDHIKEFLNRGGILATGIIPTNAEYIERETTQSLIDMWQEQTAQLEVLGLARSTIVAQTLITPSCGTGAVTEEQAQKVLELTRDVSAAIREMEL